MSRKESGTDNIYEKAFAGKVDPMPILNGIGGKDGALMAREAAVKYDADEEYHRKIAEILRVYSDE